MKDFLIYMAQSSICLSIFGLVYLLFLRKQTFFKFNRLFLLGGLLLSLIAPSIELTYNVLVTSSATSFDWTKLIIPQATMIADTPIDLWYVLGAVYLLGIGILIVRHVGMVVKIYQLKQSGKRSAIGSYHLIDNENIRTPFSILNEIFINSHKMQEKEKELILKHEICHIKQKHWLDLLGSECALLLQWFNPLMWYYIYLQKENHEYLADQSVLQNGESTAVYRAVLINQRFQGPVFSFTNSFNYSNQQNRLNMMKKMKTSPWKKAAVLAVLPLLGVFFALSAKPNYVMEQEMPEEWQKTIVAKDTVPALNIVVVGDKGGKLPKTLPEANPLIIIDGKETDMTSDELQKLDPNTIVSISVLKDKASTDEYGEKGKNGVLMIRLKELGADHVKPQLSADEIAQINLDAQKAIADMDIDAIIREVNESVKEIGKIKIEKLEDLEQLKVLDKLQSLDKLKVLNDLSMLGKLRESDITAETKKSLQELDKLNALKDLKKLYAPE